MIRAYFVFRRSFITDNIIANGELFEFSKTDSERTYFNYALFIQSQISICYYLLVFSRLFMLHSESIISSNSFWICSHSAFIIVDNKIIKKRAGNQNRRTINNNQPNPINFFPHLAY